MNIAPSFSRLTDRLSPLGDTQKGRSRWLVLAMLFIARTCVALQFQSVASVGSALVGELQVEFALLGTLIGLYMLPGIALALPGGLFMQRLGPWRIALIGIVLMSAGAGVMAASSSIIPMSGGRLISGAGAVLLGLALPKMIDDWFVGREVVTAMSILISSWPFGIAIGLIGFPVLMEAAGWKAVMLSTCLVPLASMILLATYCRPLPASLRFSAPSMNINLSSHEWLLVSLAGISYGLFNAAYVAVVSFGPDLLKAHGYSPGQASALVSLVGWTLLGALPVGGFIVGKLGRPVAWITFGLGLITLATLALPLIDYPATLLVLVALGSGFTGGTMVALPMQVLRTESRAVGIGIFYTWYFAAMTALPAVAGLGRDLGRSASGPIFAAAAMTLLALAGIVAFQLARHPITRAED